MKLRARSLDQALDHQNIWLWIQACNVRHAERCIATPVASRQPSQVPDWVIDTTAACLVAGSSAERYVALSYVWPSDTSPADTLLLERATLPHFQTPGFFLDDYNVARIPRVIQDAVRLTQGFGERFIWVDRLCLIQNDNETYTQVQQMHEIYWGAYVTIVAAASGSLYGREDWPKPSASDLQKNNFPHHANNDADPGWSAYHLALMNEHYARLSRSKWGTRGWTYQEKILSRRTIILLDDDMFWDCQCALWDCNGLDPFTEETQSPGDSGHGDGHHHPRRDLRLTPSTAVDFSLYVELVCPYNGRDLRHAQDIIPAFTGILNTLAPAFPGGFAAAIPLAYLDTMLLWQPRRGAAALRRVGASSPSWSWTGWRCEIDPWSLRSGLAARSGTGAGAGVEPRAAPSALQRAAGSWLLWEGVECLVASPEASWHVAAGLVRPGRVEVQQDGAVWFRAASSGDGTSAGEAVCLGPVPRDLPPVDTLLFFRTSSASFRVTAKEKAFQEPPEAEVRFRKVLDRLSRPAPSAAAGLFGSSTALEGTGTGFGSTKTTITPKVSVFASFFSTSLEPVDEGTSVILGTTSGRFAGVIRMLDDRAFLGSTVELVALSRGSVRYRDLDAEYEERWRQEILQSPESTFQGHGGLPHPSLRSLLSSSVEPLPVDSGGNPLVSGIIFPEVFRPDKTTTGAPRATFLEDDGIYEFFNVLLIERQGQVACRRGCGRVPKSIWEDNALPAQQFILT